MTKQEALDIIIDAAEQWTFELDNEGRWRASEKIEAAIVVVKKG